MIKFTMTTTRYFDDERECREYLNNLVHIGHPLSVIREVARLGRGVWQDAEATTSYSSTRVPDHCPLCGAPGHGDKECVEIPF